MKTSKNWIGSRQGMMMILAALVAIVVVTAILYAEQIDERKEISLLEGDGLTRLLASMPYEQLAQTEGHSNILQLINFSQLNQDFAYVALIDIDGNPLNTVSSHGAVIPEIMPGIKPSLWLTEHDFELNQRSVHEFQAPLLSNGKVAGYIRVGYYNPGLILSLSQLSFIAKLALPVFLLVPVFYLIMYLEIRPLKKAGIEIEKLIHQREFQLLQNDLSGEFKIQTMTVDSSGEFGEFMSNFNMLLGLIRQRMDDLSEKQSANKESTLMLSYQGREMETALQTLPDAIIILDKQGVAKFVNDKIEYHIGISKDAILGHLPNDWCDNKQIIDLLSNCLGETNRLRRFEAIEFCPDNNNKKTISVSAHPLFSPLDNSIDFGTLVIFRDISQEIIASKARDDFINHVSHELKSPLNVIHMYAENLLGEDADDEQTRVEAINVINDETERLSQLINNLLSITQMEVGSISFNIQPVKFADFITDTFETVSRSGLNKKINFELILPNDLGLINIDKEMMRIAINNLLSNAVKYNKTEGSVILEVEENADNYNIRISDTGMGISANDIPMVFDRFFRSESDSIRQRAGHGLGLTLAKEIIDMHHGIILIDSQEGTGTTFTIELYKDFL